MTNSWVSAHRGSMCKSHPAAHRSDWWHGYKDSALHRFLEELGQTFSFYFPAFYPQQEVSCVVVGRFCLVLMVVVKGRWLCSDETRCSPCSIDLFTNSWRKPESASSHGEMNNKWLFTSFFSCKVITESPFTDVIQHFPCFLTLLTVCLEMSLPNNNFLVTRLCDCGRLLADYKK